jgi:hypothetical protein
MSRQASAAHRTAELLLTEQLEFVNVKANTVIGIERISPDT